MHLHKQISFCNLSMVQLHLLCTKCNAAYLMAAFCAPFSRVPLSNGMCGHNNIAGCIKRQMISNVERNPP